MSLVRHANSPYWYASFMINGKPYLKSTKTNNKALAQKVENELRRKAIEEIHFEKNETCTLKEIIDEHLELKKPTEMTERAKKCFAQLETVSRKLLGYKLNNMTKEPIEVYGFEASMPFHELTSKHLVRLMMARRSEGVSTGTFLHELLFINALMTTAKQLGYQVPDIDIKAFKKEHKVKQEKGTIHYLTEEQENKLLDELDPLKDIQGLGAYEDRTDEQIRIRRDNYDFVVTLLDTGARHEEIATLEWSQVDLVNKQIRLIRGKTKNESTLQMTKRLYLIMQNRSENKRSEQWVFTNKNGGHRGYNIAGLQGAMKRAGIEGSFHTLRKTLASKLVRNGLAISDVSAILGHSNVTTTASYYASLSPSEASKRAVAMLDL